MDIWVKKCQGSLFDRGIDNFTHPCGSLKCSKLPLASRTLHLAQLLNSEWWFQQPILKSWWARIPAIGRWILGSWKFDSDPVEMLPMLPPQVWPIAWTCKPSLWCEVGPRTFIRTNSHQAVGYLIPSWKSGPKLVNPFPSIFAFRRPSFSWKKQPFDWPLLPLVHQRLVVTTVDCRGEQQEGISQLYNDCQQVNGDGWYFLEWCLTGDINHGSRASPAGYRGYDDWRWWSTSRVDHGSRGAPCD